MKRIANLVLAAVVAAPCVVARPAVVTAQAPAAQAPQGIEARLAAIEKAVDDKRKELGIPGASLVIVKDDKVIYMKGLGLRDVDRNLPVTPDTLFAIGSSSKAFTAMTVMMSADAGKLSVDDSPKKYLPFFKLQDPEADAKITIRDLLSHRSGLNRTDLAMITGRLTTDELIEVVSHAKPTAKLGEKFQYQNIMFVAAGQIAAKVNGTTWPQLVADRIFQPLGMTSTNVSVPETLKAADHSLGYEYNFETKQTRELPMRDIVAIAPAGAINSSARDMAQWLRFMLGGGVVDGKRLVSQKNFDEVLTKQMTVEGKIGYGFGWFLREWNGHKIAEHGGNIDGFNAQVALMPDQKLGMVLLTNVTGSPLGNVAMDAVWSNLVGDPNSTAAVAPGDAVDPKLEAGTYTFAEAGFDVEIAYADGKLTMTVPGQPVYSLDNVGGRRYKLTNASSGFFVTFRPAKADPKATEVYLEQPQGNFVLARKVASQAAAAAAAAGSGPAADLVGTYTDKDKKGTVEVKAVDGKVSMVVPGQPPYALVEKSKDVYSLAGLPDQFEVTARRDAAGKATGFLIKQPQGDFEFTRVADFAADLTVDQLMAKVADALGGEAAIRSHKSMVIEIDVDFENQGVAGVGTTYTAAPNLAANTIKLTALGKEIGYVRDFYDGAAGASETSFSPRQDLAGKQLDDARVNAAFYEPVDWKTIFKTVEIKRKDKVGDEEVYVVVKTPEKGDPVTDYISTKTFLPLKRETLNWDATSNRGYPVTTSYADYRKVGGVMIPFQVTVKDIGNGDIVTRIKSVTQDVAIPEAVFKGK